jgi:hypothetical protein
VCPKDLLPGNSQEINKDLMLHIVSPNLEVVKQGFTLGYRKEIENKTFLDGL